MLWENLREEEFEPMLERTHRVCAVAIGCLEKHGQHLPLGTDTLESGKVLELAAEREEVCVFPKLFFGDLQGAQAGKAGAGRYYGYVALSAELLMQMLRELCDEIGRNGFTKILLFSGHGGNNGMIANFVRAVCDENKPYEVFSAFNHLIMPKDILGEIALHGRDAFPAIADEDIAVMEDYVAKKKFDGHAGFGESAMILGTYPELIRLDRCEVNSGMSTHYADPIMEAGLNWGKAWKVNYPDAYTGHAPIGLTPAIADAAVEIAVQRAVKILKLLKNDEVMDPIIRRANMPDKGIRS